MDGITTVDYLDWESFRRDYRGTLFGPAKADKNRYLFRGQSDAAWRLESSFDRWFTGTGRAPALRNRVFLELFEQFTGELLNSPDYHRDIVNMNKNEVMALGQHYGLPTRLLDWSRSLYIAAYFAFSDALFRDKKSKRVAIWALDAKSPVWSGSLGAEIVRLPAKSNARLRNQESCFTLLNSVSPCLEDFVREATNGSNDTLVYQLTVPTAYAEEAVQDLDFIGFSARRLFPDLEGYARAAFAEIATS